MVKNKIAMIISLLLKLKSILNYIKHVIKKSLELVN